jgi:transposase-like protein
MEQIELQQVTIAPIVSQREKGKAHSLVRRAIKDGVLVRPSHCSTCARPSVSLVGHHDDYRKPLDVRWLCKSCHVNVHVQDIGSAGREVARRKREWARKNGVPIRKPHTKEERWKMSQATMKRKRRHDLEEL